MDRELQQIHRLLDGGLSSAEERDILEMIEADPRLKKEFDGLSGAIGLIESGTRLPVDATFSRGVMNRLPVRRAPVKRKLADFLFGERVLRWNVAAFAAVSAVILLLIVAGVAYRSPGKISVVAGSASPATEVKTVTLTFHAPEARAVSLAGDFNKWSVEEGVMKKRSDGTWIIELPLNPGIYHYMFVIDGEGWVADPRAESYRDDGFGNKNAILRVNKI